MVCIYTEKNAADMHRAYTQRRKSIGDMQTHACTVSIAKLKLPTLMDSGLRSSCKAVSNVIAVRAHCALVNTDLHNFEHHLSQPVGGICEKSQEAKKTFFCHIPSYTLAIILLSA